MSWRYYAHESGEYPLTGRGRTNFYAAFCELAYKLVAAKRGVGDAATVTLPFRQDEREDFFAAIAKATG